MIGGLIYLLRIFFIGLNKVLVSQDGNMKDRQNTLNVKYKLQSCNILIMITHKYIIDTCIARTE